MRVERQIGKLLARNGLTMAIAESCTGGLITHRITNIPGSSDYLERGYVVYSNRSKSELLAVDPELVQKHGAVSRQVARAMAAGVCERSGVDFGLGVTGIAGPLSDQSQKPVGLVYIAVCEANGSVRIEKHNFKGTRIQVKRQSAEAALRLLLKTLQSRCGDRATSRTGRRI